MIWDAVRAVAACERYRVLSEYRAWLADADATGVLTAELDEAAGGPGCVTVIGEDLWDHANSLLDRVMALLETRTLNAPFLTRPYPT